MTWRWIRVRAEGAALVFHAVDVGWPATLTTACGSDRAVDVEIGTDGERRCLRCARRLAAG